MTRLIPMLTTDIPVHPLTAGSVNQRLVVEKHEFLAPIQPPTAKVAFLWSHGTGFHKEILHPLMRRTLARLRELPRYNQTDFDFYAWDCRNHGDSARLNEGHVHEPTFNWIDNSLDTVQIVVEMKLKEKYDKVIGVGHNLGGTSIASHPQDDSIFEEIKNDPTVLGALKRRDTWKSREECFKAFESHPFWRNLHPEVLQNYVTYGLYDTDDGTVKLKCPKTEEHQIYVTTHHCTPMAFGSLRSLSIPAHIIHAKNSAYTDPKIGPEILAQSAMLTNSYAEGSHMIALEVPDIIVPEIIQLTNRIMGFSVKEHAKL